MVLKYQLSMLLLFYFASAVVMYFTESPSFDKMLSHKSSAKSDLYDSLINQICNVAAKVVKTQTLDSYNELSRVILLIAYQEKGHKEMSPTIPEYSIKNLHTQEREMDERSIPPMESVTCTRGVSQHLYLVAFPENLFESSL